MANLAVGIDLGTSNSCVAAKAGDDVSVLANAYGETTTASVVAFHEDGSITVGNAARANIIHDPLSTVSSAKRLIGRYHFSEEVRKAQAICAYEIVEGPNHGVRIKVREEEFSLPEVSAMVLREMKQVAEARLNEEVTKAVITVPAYFNDNQRQATKDAGRIAGLEVLRILNEPTAAALAYGFGKGLDQRVAVYDLGGGTFDISVLEIGKDVFEVLATCGDTFLGGDDFDDRILDLLADEFVAREGINLRNDPFAFEKLKVAAEAAKKALSVDDEVEVRIPDVLVGEDGQPRSLERTITASEFATLVQDLVQRTFKVCDEALQQADLTTRDLDGIILVGGPTRLPLIREAVRNYFQQEPRADVDPDEVVAKGAAIHAASLLSTEQESYLFDVTPLDLRIGVAGGLAEAVIERNTPVPIEQSRAFSPFKDHQESVQIKVYQGDSRQASENELLGQFEFSGFEPGRRSDVSIDVGFEINADGIVSVAASDPVTGESASTTITLSSGLSDVEMNKILSKDRTADVRITGGELAADEGEDAVLLEGEPELLVGEDDDLNSEITQTDLSDFDSDFDNDPDAITATDDLSGDPNDTVPIEGLLSEDGDTVPIEGLLSDDGDAEPIEDLLSEDGDAEPIEDLLSEDGDAGPNDPSNAAIGKIQLQTVQVPPAPPMAPGADGAPVIEENVDDLFDHSDELNLSADTDPEN